MKDRNGNERHYTCHRCTRGTRLGLVSSHASRAGRMTSCVHAFAMRVAAERQAAELLGTTFPDIDTTDYDEDA